MTSLVNIRYHRADSSSFGVVSSEYVSGWTRWVGALSERDTFLLYSGRPSIVAVCSFMVAPDKLSLKIDRIGGQALAKPISVSVICESDNEFIASADDLNMAMPGETAGEALTLLKAYISDVYYNILKSSRLGPEPTRQLGLLEEHFGKRGEK